METFEGKCPKCGRTHHSHSKNDPIVCDCWRLCPLCSAEMTTYTPDLAPNTYGLDGKRELRILMVCTRHSPTFISTQKPVEVACA